MLRVVIHLEQCPLEGVCINWPMPRLCLAYNARGTASLAVYKTCGSHAGWDGSPGVVVVRTSFVIELLKMRPADSGVKIDTVRLWICLLDPREKWLNDCDKNHMWTRPLCIKFE